VERSRVHVAFGSRSDTNARNSVGAVTWQTWASSVRHKWQVHGLRWRGISAGNTRVCSSLPFGRSSRRVAQCGGQVQRNRLETARHGLVEAARDLLQRPATPPGGRERHNTPARPAHLAK
jgi:hypothetical protein